MSDFSNPLTDPDLPEFSEVQVRYLCHHISNTLFPLQCILEMKVLEEAQQSWLKAAIVRFKTLREAICSRRS